MDADLIQRNLDGIQEKIFRAAEKSGRPASSARLMAVTKRKSAEIIERLISAGVREFGENYPEETLQKIHAFQSDGVVLNMIGHLQSRKAKIVAAHFDCFQSCDRLDIALRMEKLCAAENRILPIFLECNVGGEESKKGWLFKRDELAGDAFLADVEKILQLSHLRIVGLMALPPYVEDGEENRAFFIQIRRILEEVNRHFQLDLHELSMGTSGDFEVAIEEGATIVRVGTALVGPRDT